MTSKFSGSTIKSWFQYRCERKIRYELFDAKQLRENKIEKIQRRAPWAKTGIDYENRVVAALAEKAGRVLKPSQRDLPLEQELTKGFLLRTNDAVYAAQADISPPQTPAFLAGTGLELKSNLPDLIRYAPVDGSKAAVFTIIDIKATRRATPFHRTQVAFYSLVLEELFRQMGLPTGGRFDDHGEIWHVPDDDFATGERAVADRFLLRPYRRLVEEFCQQQLPAIAQKLVANGQDETFFHLYFKCEQCDYVRHCQKSVAPGLDPEVRDVSAVAGLTHEAKRALARMKIKSVSDLSKARHLETRQGAGWTLTRRAALLTARARALAEDAILRTAEQHTYLMPPRADVMLLLSVDHDPVDDRIAAIGYRRVENGRMTGERIAIPKSSSLEDEAEAMTTVLAALVEDLGGIDLANASAPPGQGIFAHIFVFEPSEAKTLQQALGRHLDNPQIRGGLLHLVRLFPPEDVVPEPEFRGVHHLPATAVRTIVETLYALPAAVSYDLRQVSQALARLRTATPYEPQEDFGRNFSSLLSIDIMRPIREGAPDAKPVDLVVRDVEARLEAFQSVLAWLYEENRQATAAGAPLLRLAKKPFRFQATFNPLQAADLDVLLACELLENRAGLLEALVNLAQPTERRRESGRCMSGLILRKKWPAKASLLFEIPLASRDAELGPEDFFLILTNDNPDLRLDGSSRASHHQPHR